MDSGELRNEGERPTGHPETMAGAGGMQRDVSRAPAPLFVAEHDRKSPYFHLEIGGLIYLGNPMETRKKVTDSACGQSRGMGQIHLDMVTRVAHLDLQVASPPLGCSETRADDPRDTPRRWRGRWACRASPAALRRRSLMPKSIANRHIFTWKSKVQFT